MRRFLLSTILIGLSFFAPREVYAVCEEKTDQQKFAKADIVAIGQNQRSGGSTQTFRILRVYKGDSRMGAAYVSQPAVADSDVINWIPNAYYLLYLVSAGQVFTQTDACMGTRQFSGTFSETEQSIFGPPPSDVSLLQCEPLSPATAIEQSDVVVLVSVESAQVYPTNIDAPVAQRVYDQIVTAKTSTIFKGDTSLIELNIYQPDYLHAFTLPLGEKETYLLYLKDAGMHQTSGDKVYTMLKCANNRLVDGPLTAAEAEVLNPLGKTPVPQRPLSNSSATPFTIEDLGLSTCGPGPGAPKEPDGGPWVVGLLVIGAIVWPWRTSGLPQGIARHYRQLGWIIVAAAVGLTLAVVVNFMFVSGWNAARTISLMVNILINIPTAYACVGYADVALTAFNLLSLLAFLFLIPSMIGTLLERRRLVMKTRASTNAERDMHPRLPFAIFQTVITVVIVIAFAVVTYFNLNR